MAGVPYNPLAASLDPKRRKENPIASALMASTQNAVDNFNASPFSQALNSDINRNISAVASALMAPGDALSGKYNYEELTPNGYYTPLNSGLLDAANNMAGVVALSSAPLPRPSSSLGMFGGTRAKTADLPALAKAEALDAAGVPKQSILRETGWFKGEDGKWRFEISDDKASVSPSYRAAESFDNIPLSNAVNHPALYEAYPELYSYVAQHRPFPAAAPAGTYGSFVKGRNAVVMNSDAPSFSSDSKLRSNILHEMQHAVQRLEGFEGGTNLDGGMKAYMNNLGEREARAVQMRSNLTPAQRLRILPNY